MPFQTHHIIYKNDELGTEDWTVSLNGIQHQTVTAIQRTKATPEKYAALTNFVHAVSYEWNKMRAKLDKEN